jgi:putative tricarboxylic transport membrane protein
MRQHGIASHSPFLQLLVGIGVVVLALGLGVGAYSFPSEAGYGGVGPNFMPWLVTVALLICGSYLIFKSRRGGFRNMEEHSGEHPYWAGFAWMSAGLLLNAFLITTIGFIFSCTLCFALAARGLRLAEAQRTHGLLTVAKDFSVGLMISAPVFWGFTKFLGINLPGLTHSGWL